MFKHPVAISWMVLADDEDGVPAPVALRTVGYPEQSEREMLVEFFADVSSYANVSLVSWGGGATDIPQVMLAASRLGVSLPQCLQAFGSPFDMRGRCHVDLMLAMNHGAARVHLAEMAAALNLPAKPLGAPGAVAGYIEAGKWSLVKATAEADVYTTSLILAHYLALTTPTSATLMCDSIASHAAALEHRPFAEDFARYRDRLRADVLAEARSAHARLAA